MFKSLRVQKLSFLCAKVYSTVNKMSQKPKLLKTAGTFHNWGYFLNNYLKPSSSTNARAHSLYWLGKRWKKEEFPMKAYGNVCLCQALNKIPFINPKVYHKVRSTSLSLLPIMLFFITLFSTLSQFCISNDLLTDRKIQANINKIFWLHLCGAFLIK